MSDYTKVFDGAAKDAGSATVLGADHDTEFDAISIAVNSKADEVASATVGNLAELTADGNLTDSGIDSDNLDGLTGVVETRLDALEPSAEVTDHVRAGGMQIVSGSGTQSGFNWNGNITESAWESVGPTGSGATNIWDDMDEIPATATAVILGVTTICTISTALGGVTVYGAQNGITPLTADQNIILQEQVDADSLDAVARSSEVIVPLDSSQRFQMTFVTAGGATINSGFLGYKGFIEDLG